MSQLERLQERHRQLIHILIEIDTARGQIATEQGRASVNNTIAASFAAIMIVTDVLRIGLSAVDERADLGFTAIDKAMEEVNDRMSVTGGRGIATRSDAMNLTESGLANASRLVGYVRDAKSIFDGMKKIKDFKLSPAAKQLEVVADVGLAMTEGFMLFYSTLRTGQQTITNTQSAYEKATAHYNKVRDQILQLKAQMDQIAEAQKNNPARGASKHERFPDPVQRAALGRQKGRCASCGHRIHDIGKRGQADHHFGEGAAGHHVIPHSMGGPLTVENCVVICESCHINAHQGGRWRDNSIYADLARLPMNEKIRRIASQYPHYRG